MKKILILLVFAPFLVNGQIFKPKADTSYKAFIRAYVTEHSTSGITLQDSFGISRRGVEFDSIVGLKLDRSETWYLTDTIRDTLVIHIDTSCIGGSANITFVVDSAYAPTVDTLSRDVTPITITQDVNSDDYDATKTHQNEFFIYRNGDRIYWYWKNKNNVE